MTVLTIERLTEQLELADELRSGRDHMLDPQDLPGRFGRVIRAVDHLLQALDCPGSKASSTDRNPNTGVANVHSKWPDTKRLSELETYCWRIPFLHRN